MRGPANFDESQRQVAEDVCEIIVLNVLRIISEHPAVAIGYGLAERGSSDRNLLIYDLGGGTSARPPLTIEDGIIEVRARASDMHLGQEDFDNRIADIGMQDLKRESRGMDILDNRIVDFDVQDFPRKSHSENMKVEPRAVSLPVEAVLARELDVSLVRAGDDRDRLHDSRFRLRVPVALCPP